MTAIDTILVVKLEKQEDLTTIKKTFQDSSLFEGRVEVLEVNVEQARKSAEFQRGVEIDRAVRDEIGSRIAAQIFTPVKRTHSQE